LSETVMEASMAAMSRLERKAARDMEKAGK
jgi:hypothetical protein